MEVMKTGLMQKEIVRHQNGYLAVQLLTLMGNKLNVYIAFNHHQE